MISFCQIYVTNAFGVVVCHSYGILKLKCQRHSNVFFLKCYFRLVASNCIKNILDIDLTPSHPTLRLGLARKMKFRVKVQVILGLNLNDLK